MTLSSKFTVIDTSFVIIFVTVYGEEDCVGE